MAGMHVGADNEPATNQAARQAIDRPADLSAKHPTKKAQHVGVWIALASAATAIVAAVISGFQVNLAGKQNTEAEQQQLVNLTSLIGQQFAQQKPSANKRQSNLAGEFTMASADQAQVALFQVEGQAAAVLINSLHGVGVAEVEYVQVARALEQTGDVADAITFYKDALTAPPNNAPTRAEALRYLGGLYYAIGQYAKGHYYEILAAKVFGKHPLQTGSYIANTIAQAYLGDAEMQLTINGCRIAGADITAAWHALGSREKWAIQQYYLAWDLKEYSLKCNGTK